MTNIQRRPYLPEAKKLHTLTPVLQQIYWHRGVHDQQFLDLSLKYLLPFTALKGINAAVSLLAEALSQQQRILIIGDFDADGATSTAVAIRALRAMGASYVDFLVPNRFQYGYGLTPEIVEVAHDYQPDLIITVDNGIASFAGVQVARTKGIKVLITDHHLPAQQLPDADAIVNPNQLGDAFASKQLAGVGVIFYVMSALRAHLRQQGWFEQHNIPTPNLAELLDLVALGTVADVVPLDYNNRILVQQGLQRIRAGRCCAGISALLHISQRQAASLTSGDLGFAIGPRLNAAGRLQDMSIGIACLLADDADKAQHYAQQLHRLNQERRSIESQMRDQAWKMIEGLQLNHQQLPMGLCLYDKAWHQGIVGIIAGRLKDNFHRPVIAFAQVSDDELKGSARSVSGLHIRDTLDLIAKRHPEVLKKFGGHAMAAGLTLSKHHLPAFQAAFIQAVSEQLTVEQLQNTIISDGELSHEELILSFAEYLQRSGPWGQHFPQPLFDGQFDVVSQRLVGECHLQLTLGLHGKLYPAIAFNINLKEWPNHRCQRVQIAYHLLVNEFNNRKNIQLQVQFIMPILTT